MLSLFSFFLFVFDYRVSEYGLPILPLYVKGDTLYVEVAFTEESRQRGLSFREKIGEREGMLFIFDEPKVLSFWMKDTYIPLDVAFIDDNGVIVDIHEMAPLDTTKIYKSSKPVRFALEVTQGYFKKKGIKKGEKVFGPALPIIKP